MAVSSHTVQQIIEGLTEKVRDRQRRDETLQAFVPPHLRSRLAI